MDYALRRDRLLQALADDAALVLPAAPELRTTGDGELRYLPAADLYYLTGYPEPEAVLVLCPSAAAPFTLFVRPRDVERERWAGVRGGVDAATAEYGADAAFEIGELASRLPDIVAAANVLYAPIDSGRADVDRAVRLAVERARRTRARTGRGPHTLIEPALLVGPLRVRKDDDEIARLRDAAGITVAAFGEAIRQVGSAAGEWQVEAAIEHGFRHRGASGPAFPSIVAAGANATVLHYVENSAPLRAGELLLIDAGARCHMYCADVTRTVPVSGRFTGAQRAIYDIVLAAHDAAIAAVRPGATAAAIDDAALPVLIGGMKEIGLVHGSMDEIMESGSYRRWFPHRTSHWLGLDVHDAGDYVVDGASVELLPGMVLTVEPGLYIGADDEAAPAALRATGVRLEDDVLVTTAGADVLTGALPIRPDDMEYVVREGI
jgi:Xaa-Pro aminopeptidase